MAQEASIGNLKPFFDGTDYPLWKHKMEFYLDSETINLWDMVLDGWSPPMTKERDKEILTPRKDWTKEQKEANAKNRKAVTVLLSSLSREECCRVQRCDSAKDVWETLQNYHEGTSQVRQ